MSSRKLPSLANCIRLLMVLTPIAICGWLVRQHATDVRFFDDWMMAETLVKWHEGTLTLHDIFAVQMEHRLAVPRLLALGLHAAFGEDMRLETGATFLLLLGTAWNLVWLLRRVAGLAELRQWWLPAMLMFMVLFSPVQVQTLLWPICFTSVLPGFCLSLALVSWFSKLPRPLALAAAWLCALAATLSFATGLLLWVLMVPVLLFSRSAEASLRSRVTQVIIWCLLTAGSLGLYFRNFESSVNPEFAYDQGGQVTMLHSISVFLGSPKRASDFVFSFLGCHLGRGLHQDNLQTAWLFGLISILLFLAVLAYLIGRRWRDGATWDRAMPWLVFGTHGIATGVMIAMGRLWVTRSLAQAVTIRYTAYAAWLTLGLIGLVSLIASGRLVDRDGWLARRHNWRSVGIFLAAFFIGLQSVAWSYGSRIMGEWEATRRQNAAALLFVKHLKPYGYLTPVSPNGDYVANLALRLDAHDQLSPKPLRSLELGLDLKIGKTVLKEDHASFDAMWLDKKTGKLNCQGFAELPGAIRPADAILFTTLDRAAGRWRIFGFAAMNTTPGYLRDSTMRDLEFISATRWNPPETKRWDSEVFTIEIPPQGSEIAAWALDAEHRRVYRIIDRRSSSASAPLHNTIIYPRTQRGER